MKVEAPWTREMAENLNRWQRCGWVHEFTCGSGNRMDAAHLTTAKALGFGDPGTLVATRRGWICPACLYRQTWAHDFMMQGPPPHPFGAHDDPERPS